MRKRTDAAGVLLIAKAPVAGLVKTRLAVDVGHESAAELAAAALLDTLDAVEQTFGRGSRVAALAGDLKSAARSAELSRRLASWDVVGQRGKGFGDRLAAAHADAARLLRKPVLQIGSDTPQVTPSDLRQAEAPFTSDNRRAVVGPTDDGGWWLLGVASAAHARPLSGVPMSNPGTRLATERMLTAQGLSVVRVMQLRDVDTIADAEAVAWVAGDTRFAEAWRGVRAAGCAPLEVYESAFSGSACRLHGLPGGPTELPMWVWHGRCDAADVAMLRRCVGPTLDVGCGPGRMTQGLATQGIPTLGIDLAAGAVKRARERGAQALQRDVFGPLPAEGRWATVLLADGNIGIGGNPERLMRRVAQLLGDHGRVIVEVARPGTPLSIHAVRLEADGRISSPFRWAVLGPEALAEIARRTSLRLMHVVGHGGRWFAELHRTSERQLSQ